MKLLTLNKPLLLVALLMVACQEDNSRTQQSPPPPKNIVFEESIRVDHFDISVYLDKKRNVTCWLAISNSRTDTGSAIWCMKNNPETTKDK
jgi:hypothetical protein